VSVNSFRPLCLRVVCTVIFSSIMMCIPSDAAVVGTLVFCCIVLASLAGPLNIICIPKCVRIAISGLASWMICMASSVVMCPFHGLPAGRMTQSRSRRTPSYCFPMPLKYSLSEV